MVIVDFHVHYFTQAYVDRPERYFRSPVTIEFLRQQILPNIAYLNGGRVPFTEEYLARMGDQGIDRVVVFGLADTISGCRELNDAVADLSLRYRQGAARIYGLATVPLAEPDAAVDELNRAVRDLGFRGVKIYPSFSGLPLHAPEVRTLLEEAARLGAVVLTDCSFLCWPGGPAAMGAANLLADLVFSPWFREIEGLRLVAAHLGGGLVFFRDLLATFDPGVEPAFERVWFDLSPVFPASMIRAALAVVPPQRLLFGSDFPFTDGSQNLTTIAGMGLPAHDARAILGENALGLLGT